MHICFIYLQNPFDGIERTFGNGLKIVETRKVLYKNNKNDSKNISNEWLINWTRKLKI